MSNCLEHSRFPIHILKSLLEVNDEQTRQISKLQTLFQNDLEGAAMISALQTETYLLSAA